MDWAAKIRKTALQPFHFSALEVVERCNDFGSNVMDNFILLDQLRHPLGMASCIVINAAACADGGSDALGDVNDMARQVAALASCSDCTAAGMAHDNHQRGP